jgi:enoyl-CoA hydratase/carnithine racemase
VVDHVQISRDGPVQLIRLNRPEKRNAITGAMYAVMTAALTAGNADPSVRCHVFLGSGGVFTAGNDLADFLAVSSGGDIGGEILDFLLALATSGKPIVSGVDGIAVGIGATLNLHCDLTFATPRTVFRTNFVDLGLVPEAGSSLLAPAVLGYQRAFAVLALGEDMAAEQALACGLIHAVVPPEELEAATRQAAHTIASKPQKALRIARDLLRGPPDRLVARIREECRHFEERLRSDEARAAFQAFMARRKA